MRTRFSVSARWALSWASWLCRWAYWRVLAEEVEVKELEVEVEAAVLVVVEENVGWRLVLGLTEEEEVVEVG